MLFCIFPPKNDSEVPDDSDQHGVACVRWCRRRVHDWPPRVRRTPLALETGNNTIINMNYRHHWVDCIIILSHIFDADSPTLVPSAWTTPCLTSPPSASGRSAWRPRARPRRSTSKLRNTIRRGSRSTSPCRHFILIRMTLSTELSWPITPAVHPSEAIWPLRRLSNR